MAQYAYRVITPAGKEKKGVLEAKSRDAAMVMLKQDKNVVVSCEEATGLKKPVDFLSKGKKIKPRDFALFCHQFHSINAAGVSVVESFEMLAEQTENEALCTAIKEVHTDISKGETLANSMRKRGGVFPEMLNNMVEAGEASGSLDKAFERMAIQFEKEAALEAAVKKAITYPIILIVVMVAVIFIVMVKVIPTFMDMFEDLDVEMPAITMAVIHISDFFVAWWWLLLILIIGIIFGFKAYAATDSGKEVTSSLALKIPVLGPVKTKSACARLGRTLCTLLGAGVPMVDAIEITGRSMENMLYKRAMKEARDQVLRGVPLSKPLKTSGLFPNMVVHMVAIGEETGNIEAMLENVANYYEEDVQLATEQMMTILEPMIIVVMAVVVGFLVLAILSPMFTLYDALG
ncbi:MAG: type II secretion system F family protein [Lachnospiraceae bacterium]|nr:type II secretion system F family protein [Lachnospiraceae bacterium]